MFPVLGTCLLCASLQFRWFTSLEVFLQVSVVANQKVLVEGGFQDCAIRRPMLMSLNRSLRLVVILRQLSYLLIGLTDDFQACLPQVSACTSVVSCLSCAWLRSFGISSQELWLLRRSLVMIYIQFVNLGSSMLQELGCLIAHVLFDVGDGRFLGLIHTCCVGWGLTVSCRFAVV